MARRTTRPPSKRASARRRDGARFRAVADSTYDWESWIDVDGRLLWVNPAVESLTGYQVAECMRMHDYPMAIVHPEDRAFMVEVLRGAIAGSTGNDLEFRVLRRDGFVRWVAMSWQSIRGRHGRGLRTSVRDIDDRKQVEEQLRGAMRDAEAAARAKEEFLAMTSHELRSPLHAIAGHAELLLGLGLTDKQRRHLDVIREQCDELVEVVGDLLTFAREASDGVALVAEAFDVREIIARSVARARLVAEQKGLSLETDIEPIVPAQLVGDPRRLRQVLANLVGNAVKFTAAGSVKVIVRKRGGGDGAVCLSFQVEDTGIGLSDADADAERLFDPFVQADTSISRRFGGTGLGLAIARRLCTRMGGTVTGRQRAERGSIFEVVLPFALDSGMPARVLRSASTPRAFAPDVSLATRRPLRVLIVDDSPVARTLADEQLRALGYAPDTAASAQDALELVSKQRYDVVLLDVQMPEIDGFAAAPMLRARAVDRAHPLFIVALTADVFAARQDRFGAANMDAFLSKPVELAELQALLERAVSEGPPAPSLPLLAPHGLDERVVRELLDERDRQGRPLLDRVLQPLFTSAEAALLELERALQQGNRKQASTIAHRLKGDCLLVGARHAASIASELEAAAQAAPHGGPPPSVEPLRVALADARAALLAQLRALRPW